MHVPRSPGSYQNGAAPPSGADEPPQLPAQAHDASSGRAAPGPQLIGPVPNARKLRDWALVLDSMQLAYVVRELSGGWFVIVAEDDHARALRAIELYETENRNWPPARMRERLPHPRTLIAPAIMFGLVLFFAVTGPAAAASPWFSRGEASSALILHGQPWRALTGLTLHGDILHVVGNALSGSIFLGSLNRRLGDGRGTFFTLIAGTVGNLLNAAWHRTGHISIGASTAVFAAVGLLAATQLLADRKGPKPPVLERMAPVVGSLALLGMLGASPHSDLLAHLFGLFAGLALGLSAHKILGGGRVRGPAAQALFGVLSVLMVAGAWTLAWR